MRAEPTGLGFDRLCRTTGCSGVSVNRGGVRGSCLDCIADEFRRAGFEIIGEYARAAWPVQVRCLSDPAHIGTIRLSTVREGGRCPRCPRTKSCTSATCGNLVEITGKGLTGKCLPCIDAVFEQAGVRRVSPYLGAKKLLDVVCQTCLEPARTTLRQVETRGTGCAACSFRRRGRMRRASQREVAERFEAIGLTLLEEYQDYNTPLLVRCHACGNESRLPYQSVVRRGRNRTRFRGCTNCAVEGQAQSYSLDADDAARILTAAGATLIGGFRSVMRPVEIICNACGAPSRVRINNVQNGHSPCWPCARASARDKLRNGRTTPGFLYLFRFDLDGEEFLKIGIGIQDGSRLDTHRHLGGELLDLAYGSIAECYVAEQIALVEVANRAVVPATARLTAGRTECFRPDAADELQPVRRWVERASAAISNGDLPPMRSGFRPALM